MRDAEKALDYLVETDEKSAQAKALMLFIEDKKKTVKATQMANMDGSISGREMEALASDEYKAVCDEYRDAVYDYEMLRNRRKSAELTIELWRSMNANRRQGNV